MNKELCDKLNALPIEERKMFSKELNLILNDRTSAAMYGIIGEDYNKLPLEKVEEVEEKLYHNLFESNNNSINSSLFN